MLKFNNEKFISALKEFKGDKNQEFLASELGINNRSTISLYENKKQIPTLDVLKKLCEKTNTGVESYFINEKNDPVFMMMGQLNEGDKPHLEAVLARIKIREKYLAFSRR